MCLDIFLRMFVLSFCDKFKTMESTDGHKQILMRNLIEKYSLLFIFRQDRD